MKKLLTILLFCLLLSGCAANPSETTVPPTETTETAVLQETAGTQSPSEPSARDLTAITVFIPNQNFDGFNTIEIQGEKLSALEAMVLTGILPKDVQVNSYSWSGDTLTVDFNAAFRDLLYNQGTIGEHILMGCVVNTLSTLNNVTYVVVTVEGEILESDHVVYDFPM